jgi:large subunit ribosomal protein L22
MEVKAIHRYARISDQKARQVTRAITGMPVSKAISVLNFTPKKAALLIGKVLRSAVANAEHNHELDADTLYVKSAVATTAGMLKRMMPRARGSADTIKKRMSHITVIVEPREEQPEEPKKGGRPRKPAAAVQQ